MLVAIDLMLLVGMACAVWALWSPQPSASRPPFVMPAAVRSVKPAAGKARAALTAVLARVGKGVPRLGRQDESLREQLVYTGVRLAGEQLAGIKVLSAIGCAFVAFLVARELGEVPPFVPVLGGGFGLVLPRLWFQSRIRRRRQRIVKLLPEAIDLLSLCIGAGLDFLAAINKVVLVKAFAREPLIEEFSIVLQEIKLGKRRFEALKGIMRRVNAPEVSSFVRTLVQADRMGTPIAEVLSIHSEDVRFQRFQRAERAAVKAPIKILAPLIFCIMPCVGIIVAAPIFLQFMRQNPFGQ